jgi:hypothetical protein
MIVKDFKKFFDHQGLCFIHFVLFLSFSSRLTEMFLLKGSIKFLLVSDTNLQR